MGNRTLKSLSVLTLFSGIIILISTLSDSEGTSIWIASQISVSTLIITFSLTTFQLGEILDEISILNQ